MVYAADAGESAQDGLFTPTLLKYLTSPGWNLSRILQRTRADVLAASNGKQSPGEYSQLLSDVYLAGSSGAAVSDAPSIEFALKQTYGSLEVSARTAGRLYLDGKSMGSIPADSKAELNNIPVGTHDLEMRYGSETEKKRVTVGEGRSLKVAFSYVERSDSSEDFVFVEGGTFTMGSPESESGRDDDEVQHQVKVGSFYMKETEVTHREYLEFLNSAGVSRSGKLNGNEVIDLDDDDAAIGYTGGRFKFTGSSNASTLETPVIEVTWYGATEYCNWLSREEGLTPVYRISDNSLRANWSADGYRLPTEAEWEYAARGGKKSRGHKYSGSNTVGEVAWYDDNSGGKTHPVGDKRANELGLYDMSGNVWEWCWDWDGDYSGGSQTDPRGPSGGSDRVRRGGGWDGDAEDLRSASRDNYAPSRSDDNLGFRPLRRT